MDKLWSKFKELGDYDTKLLKEGKISPEEHGKLCSLTDEISEQVGIILEKQTDLSNLSDLVDRLERAVEKLENIQIIIQGGNQ